MKKRRAEKTSDKQVHIIRGKKVILEFDAAELYGVNIKTLRRAVNRNKERFPVGYIMSLDPDEYNLLTGNNISSLKNPKGKLQAFTKHGFIMLSNVLNSRIAAQLHVDIIRALHTAGQLSFATFGIHVTKEEDISLN